MPEHLDILELNESLASLNNAASLILNETRNINNKLDEYAKEIITAYEKFEFKYALPVKRDVDYSNFDPLNESLDVDFRFVEIKDDYIKVSASFCTDEYGPSYAYIWYSFQIDIVTSGTWPQVWLANQARNKVIYTAWSYGEQMMDYICDAREDVGGSHRRHPSDFYMLCDANEPGATAILGSMSFKRFPTQEEIDWAAERIIKGREEGIYE